MLHYEVDHYAVTDLGSSNGTLVNGIKIRSATPLADGDRITVGQHALVFTAAAPQAPGAAPPAKQTSEAEAPAPPATQIAGSAAAAEPIALDALAADSASASSSDNTATAAADAEEPSLPVGSAHTTENTSSALPGEEAIAAAAAPADPRSAPLPREAFFGVPSASNYSSLAPERPIGQTPPGTGDLKQVRTQLVETSEVLAAWTESAAAHTKQLRTALAELAERVDTDLGGRSALSRGSYGAVGDGGALDTLIRVAEQVAADPQHLNSLMALAGRCQDIADTLKNQQTVLATLDMVRDRLAQLAQEEGW
jgi:hypothetical protein